MRGVLIDCWIVSPAPAAFREGQNRPVAGDDQPRDPEGMVSVLLGDIISLGSPVGERHSQDLSPALGDAGPDEQAEEN